ncbi:MAG: hypothetical protein R3225_01150 [Halofilum sp. (in: g-proteobacteria)]|nr:hypothetical protein [Halofilum sp. (in: g-proteobacteria)]
MFPDTVLIKTVRGREEIKTRAHDLSAMQRRLLILVDGVRSVAEISDLLGRSKSDPIVMRDLKVLERERYVDRADEVESVA